MVGSEKMEVKRIMMHSSKVFALSMLMLLTISVIPIGLSSAQQVDVADETNAVELLRLYVANGRGVAVDDQEPYRSKIRAITFTDTEPVSTVEQLIDFGVKRGVITINLKQCQTTDAVDAVARKVFKMVPDSWSGVIGADGKNLEVKGIVTDEAGNEYTGYLKGIAARNTEKGLLLFVQGSLTGEDADYDLYYRIFVHPIKPRAMAEQTDRPVPVVPFERAQ